MPRFTENGSRCQIDSPTEMPKADAFLWNRRMMIQTTCRGYAVAQFMQPEPAKYAHVPTLAGTSFMQPEQPFFAHHPGRFFYLRDHESNSFFSAPYEPARIPLDEYRFDAGQSDIRWTAEKDGLRLELRLTLTTDDVVELWRATITNVSDRPRNASLVPYFPVGYSSWMNMSADFVPELGGIVASCIAPYQKVDDYFKRFEWKDLTYLVADTEPDSWECCQAAFEGEGGLHNPDGLQTEKLPCGDSRYEIPACTLAFPTALQPGESKEINLLFGPAKNREEIAALRSKLFAPGAIDQAATDYARYIASGHGTLAVDTPDEHLNLFVNNWLPRQVFYHGDTNRLTTDPQTRNYLQDAMGMAYIDAPTTRNVLCTALSQQAASGEMPDGILIHPEAQLKYINQIPHTDHGVWTVICLQAYLNESGDQDFLEHPLPFKDSDQTASVYQHISLALDWLASSRDERGLSFIAQGDWCDPMNMVGYKGKGVSGWLTEALSYALQLWLPYCENAGDSTRADRYRALVDELNQALNTHLWDGAWYGRGITDDNVVFGVSKDPEGRIFLNAQSWALLCGAPDAEQQQQLIQAVEDQLLTPYGAMLCAPAFTKMRDDVGRVTQKFPGSGENGSVYNHAAAFYAAALFHTRQSDAAFEIIRRMLAGPNSEDFQRRGQLPIYIPNYFRGAYYQHPRTAGRSSHLFNTGTAAWAYRLLIEQLFGLRGTAEGLLFDPQLPSNWEKTSVTRRFRGATFEVSYRRSSDVDSIQCSVDGNRLDEPLFRDIEAGRNYMVEIVLPR